MNHDSQNVVTVDNRFAMIPHWLILSDVSDGALRLYAALMKYADSTTRQAFPSRATIANDMHKSVKSVDRYLRELESLGAVRVQRRKRVGSLENQSSVYTLVTTNPRVATSEEMDSTVSTPQEVGTPVSPGGDMDDAENYTHLTTPTFISSGATNPDSRNPSEPAPTGAALKVHDQLGITQEQSRDLITRASNIYEAGIRDYYTDEGEWEDLAYVIESYTGTEVGDAITNKRWSDRLAEIIEQTEDKGSRYGAGKWLCQLHAWTLTHY